uniref:NADH dehydrogenase subunit 3 n=1 Tax=Bipalium admarginatum TaxID=3023024 RepID=UPI002410C662|nr:NADH dehydrogenase subunit 3 [Bipalium admarginatum]WEM34734.1 NADH dehydrogenase subunit 3 [Bipalium admarginatum]
MIFFFFFFLGLCLVFIFILWVYWTDLIGLVFFRETVSVFECGFDSTSKARLPFSLRFFMILIFFLLLDVEVCLLLQLPFELNNQFFLNRLGYIFFLVVLLVGIIEEFRRGLLEWKK